MKTADNRIVGRSQDSKEGHPGRAQPDVERNGEPNTLGLIVAISLCAACWTALAFFFLF